MGKASKTKKSNNKAKSVEDYKNEGNEYFQNGKALQAIKCYTAGLELLSKQQPQGSPPHPHREQRQQQKKNGSNDSGGNVTTTDTTTHFESILLGNRAMAYLKEKNYEAALSDCNVVLEGGEFQQPPAHISTLAKIYYRRAMAREGLLMMMISNKKKKGTTSKQRNKIKSQQKKNKNGNHVEGSNNDHHAADDEQRLIDDIDAEQRREKLDLFTGAKMDLQHCLQLQPDMAEIVTKVIDRIQLLLSDDELLLLAPAPTTDRCPGSSQSSSAATTVVTVRVQSKPDAPSPDRQRLVIMLLLRQRRGATIGTTKSDEAFFLVPWDWWCAFCHATELDLVELVPLLPRGATPPIIGNNNGSFATSAHRWNANSNHEKENNNSYNTKNKHNEKEFVLGEICTERLATERRSRLDDGFAVVPSELSTTASNAASEIAPTASLPAAVATTEDDDTVMLPIDVLHHWLVRGYHYEILPREVYATLVEWYGQTESSVSIMRRIRPNGKLVLYEPVSTTSDNGDTAWTAAADQTTTLSLCRRNKRAMPDHHPCAACGSPYATKFCRPCLMRYCSRSCQERHWKAVHKQLCGKQQQQQQQNGSSSDSAGTTTTTTACTAGTINDPHHRVGLGQLGNTCFLNAAIQALAHTTPLVRYFLSGAFQHDINTTNPLGSGGKLALAFDATMVGLRMAKPSVQYYSPTMLKRALAGSRFAGCQQHDAQEFLGHVLDGLHEDLNRITSYDYVELPDVPPDQHHGIAGAQVWDAQCIRNNSLLWDTFYGQFKSTCVCPDCSQVSVSFDSFNHVSLEIPQKNPARDVRLCVYLCRPDRMMERLGFRMSQQSTIRVLKTEILSLLHDDDGDDAPQHLTLCDVEDHDITTIFADSKPIVDAPRSIFAYPVNSRDESNWLIMYNHAKRNNNNIDCMGMPHLIATPKETSTCRDVWDELWRNVAALVDHDRSKVQMRLYRRNGMHNNVFPVSLHQDQPEEKEVIVEEKKLDNLQMNGDNPQDGEQKQHESDDQEQEWIEMTSIWPSTSNALVRDYISASNNNSKYLFIRIEWIDAPRVNDRTLSIYKDHPTYTKLMEELKAEKLASATKITLDQCLSTFQKPERLDEHNMWYCNKCKVHVPAMKTIELWRLPDVLILHLKRFEFRTGFRREKLDVLVEFPLEGLEVKCSQNGSLHDPDALVDGRVPAVYDCFAVINHYGRMGFGHYTAFARQWDEHGIPDNWYLFDDSRTQSVPGSDVVTDAAYVVFYRRREQ